LPLAAVAAGVWLSGNVHGQIMSKMTSTNVQDTLLGQSVQAIQNAMKVLDRYKLDLNAYRIVVVREPDSVLVIATDNSGPEGGQHDFGVKQGSREMNVGERTSLISKLDQIQPQEKVEGRNFLAIRNATEVFLRRFNADLSKYKVEVVREPNSLVVMFTGKDVPAGTFGNVVATPGFEVELKPADLTVVRSNFIR
jgi:hypothetical protein